MHNAPSEPPTLKASLADGLATALVALIAIGLGCVVWGLHVLKCSEMTFLAGGALIVLSAVWAAAGYSSPPGALSVWRGTAQVWPEPVGRRRLIWLDRFISPHNVWLTAGLWLIVLAFLLALT
jgi:hypothetical protein